MRPTFKRSSVCSLAVFLSAISLFVNIANGGMPGIPQIKDGLTQVIPELNDPDLWIRHDLWVETTFDSDGDGRLDRMHVDVTRPRQTEGGELKLPAIYISSPYFGGAATGTREYFWDIQHELGEAPPSRNPVPEIERKGTRPIISKSQVKRWLPHGYVVIHSSSPGTGLSQGCPTIGKENESLAPKAVIDWLNGRAPGYTSVDGTEPVYATWASGKVGMTGTSHPGTLALAAATTGVEGLEVIIPIAPNTSPYHYYRSHGLVRHPFGFLGEDIDVLYDFVHSGYDDRREFCDTEIRDREMAEGMDRITGDFNPFWAERDYLLDLAPLNAAVLMCHAFNDWNVVPEHSNRIYQALKDRGIPAQVFYHQGGHGGEPPLEMMNRWFAHYLFDVENDLHKGPKAWIVREGDERSNPTAYPDFPNPDAELVSFQLRGGAPKQGHLTLDTLESQTTETLIDNYSFPGAALAQADWTEHRLIYMTRELEEAIHISGSPRINIRLACDRTAANLSVWLVSLPWNQNKNAAITDNVITRGWADPQNRDSMEISEPIVPGKYYDLSFTLQPDDQVIPAGQQIGLMIFSSDQEFTLHPQPGTKLTVDLNRTTLHLPVVGGEEACQSAL